MSGNLPYEHCVRNFNLMTKQNENGFYPSEFDFDLTYFKPGDFLTLVSCKLKNLSQCDGVLTLTADSFGTISFKLPNTTFASEQDALALMSSEDITNTYNFADYCELETVYATQGDIKKFKQFHLSSVVDEQLTVNCSGSLRQYLGISKKIVIKSNAIKDSVFLDECNTARIRYAKLQSLDLNACEETFWFENGVKHTMFDRSTVVVLTPSQNYEYSDSTLAVDIQIKNASPLRFNLVDQDNVPIILTYALLEIKLTKASWYDSFQTEAHAQRSKRGPHTKRQAWLELSDVVSEVHLNHEFRQIALTDCSGRILNTIFTQDNGFIVIDEKAVDLYNLPELKIYRDKFIDYNFLTIVMNWYGTYTKNKMVIKCDINTKTGGVTFTVETDSAAFTSKAPPLSILNGLLKTNVDFSFYHNMDKVTTDTINEAKMARQQNLFEIFIDELGGIRNLGSVSYQYSKIGTLVAIKDDMIINKLNRNTWLWKFMTGPARQLSFRITALQENADGIMSVIDYKPNLVMRVLLK